MSKLWLYGDSFSTYWNSQGDFLYPKMLANKLNAELCINAYSGASLGWMMYQSMQHRHEFAEDDYIIFQTTLLDRGFLSKENPSLSKISPQDKHWKSLSNEQQKGYTFYLLDIHDNDILKTQFQAWLHGISHYTKHLKVQPLLTTAWDLGDIELPHKWRLSKGMLFDLSTKEFSGTFDDTIKWILDNGTDPRKNHFSTCNHYKITDIYYKALIDKNYTPDFNNLEQNIYDEYPRLGEYSLSGEWIK